MMHLQVLRGSLTQQQLCLDRPRCVLGSAPDADLHITAAELAPHHALLEPVGDCCLVRALHDGSPPRVNGDPVTVELLHPGDVLALGDLELCLVGGEFAPPLPSPPTPPEQQRLAAMGQLLAGTAHHLKNLLTGLTAGADLVDLGLQDGDLDTIASGWRPIRRNLDGLRDLVLNLLNFAKERQPVTEPLDLAELLGSLVELVRNRARGQNVELVLQLDPAVPLIEADPVGLHQALLNLLINALEAIPPDRPGRVELSSRWQEQPPEVALTVGDNGVGIAGEVLPRVFELFYSSKGSRGTGFGLAVTRRIVESHGGRMELHTELGVGSQFTIYLPQHGVSSGS